MSFRRTILRGGRAIAVTAEEGALLLDVLRAELGVRLASRGCDHGGCGACRVLLDGRVVNACVLAFRDVPDGARLETYEDLRHERAAVQALAAFEAERPTRCSLCVGGLGVTAVALARAGQEGNPEAVEASLATATCMCTGRGSLRRSLVRG